MNEGHTENPEKTGENDQREYSRNRMENGKSKRGKSQERPKPVEQNSILPISSIMLPPVLISLKLRCILQLITGLPFPPPKVIRKTFSTAVILESKKCANEKKCPSLKKDPSNADGKAHLSSKEYEWKIPQIKDCLAKTLRGKNPISFHAYISDYLQKSKCQAALLLILNNKGWRLTEVESCGLGFFFFHSAKLSIFNSYKKILLGQSRYISLGSLVKQN